MQQTLRRQSSQYAVRRLERERKKTRNPSQQRPGRCRRPLPTQPTASSPTGAPSQTAARTHACACQQLHRGHACRRGWFFSQRRCSTGGASHSPPRLSFADSSSLGRQHIRPRYVNAHQITFTAPSHFADSEVSEHARSTRPRHRCSHHRTCSDDNSHRNQARANQPPSLPQPPGTTSLTTTLAPASDSADRDSSIQPKPQQDKVSSASSGACCPPHAPQICRRCLAGNDRAQTTAQSQCCMLLEPLHCYAILTRPQPHATRPIAG